MVFSESDSEEGTTGSQTITFLPNSGGRQTPNQRRNSQRQSLQSRQIPQESLHQDETPQNDDDFESKDDPKSRN